MTRNRVAVCFDATRLRARLKLAQPTGIDRVDLAYLQALSADEDIALSLVVRGTFGIRQLRPAAAQQLVEDISRCWAVPPENAQPLFAAVRNWLEAPGLIACAAPAKTPSPAPPRKGEGVRSQWLLSSPPPCGEGVLWQEKPSLYLNTSHGQLYRPAYARWLRRSGLRGLFFVHDLIPIQHPEFSRAAEPARHAARLATIAKHGAGVLVNSAATRASLLDYWGALDVKAPPITIAPLGIQLGSSTLPAPQASKPYFVMLGTIEPRKNHRLLLRLWRQMIETDAAQAPRLLLIGRRGWLNREVFDLIDHSPQLASHVMECEGLDDAAVLALLRGAAALLNPSFAEGFGLPVAEALAAGVPVLASDLAAHREVGGDCAEYLDPHDEAGWLRALRDYAAPQSPRRAAALQRLGAYQAPSWQAHFRIVREKIQQLA
ncbi:MAG: glycosyltransferase family 1 protein [Pseudomonadota bacterium]